MIAATGRPGLIGPGDVRRGQIILALSNPHPEIDPVTALAAGAAFALAVFFFFATALSSLPSLPDFRRAVLLREDCSFFAVDIVASSTVAAPTIARPRAPSNCLVAASGASCG